jgi:hypothetical protein
MQFVVTLDPSKPASRLIGDCPSEATELAQGPWGVWIIWPEFSGSEPWSFLAPIFCSETGASQESEAPGRGEPGLLGVLCWGLMMGGNHHASTEYHCIKYSQ